MKRFLLSANYLKTVAMPFHCQAHFQYSFRLCQGYFGKNAILEKTVLGMHTLI